MGWFSEAVDTASDWLGGSSGSGVTDSWMTQTENAVYNGAGQASTGLDMSDIFSPIGSALGSAWDWGSKSPVVMGGIVGAASSAAGALFAPDTPAELQIDYYEKRNKKHNESISKAAKRYNGGDKITKQGLRR